MQLILNYLVPEISLNGYTYSIRVVTLQNRTRINQALFQKMLRDQEVWVIGKSINN